MMAITASSRSSIRRSAASKRPGPVGLGRGHELVVEAEPVEEGAQPRVVARRRSSDTRRTGRAPAVSGLPRCARQQLLVRHVVGHLAQPVHVVREGDEPGRDRVVGQHAGRPAAPWWCAPPRRRCRYAAGPRGRSRSRTAPGLPGRARRARRACGLPRTARHWRLATMSAGRSRGGMGRTSSPDTDRAATSCARPERPAAIHRSRAIVHHDGEG